MLDEKLASIYVKNMVSPGSITVVKTILAQLRIDYRSVVPGEIWLTNEVDADSTLSLNDALADAGFLIIHARPDILTEKIRNAIIQMIHYPDARLKGNFSKYLARKLGYDYTYLANTFSKTKGITIERFIIINRIEKTKELLKYGELSLTDIAHQLNYSSVAHLSNQFKKITGVTTSEFKKSGTESRKDLEAL